jgi:hypothetical protein
LIDDPDVEGALLTMRPGEEADADEGGIVEDG